MGKAEEVSSDGGSDNDYGGGCSVRRRLGMNHHFILVVAVNLTVEFTIDLTSSLATNLAQARHSEPFSAVHRWHLER